MAFIDSRFSIEQKFFAFQRAWYVYAKLFAVLGV